MIIDPESDKLIIGSMEKLINDRSETNSAVIAGEGGVGEDSEAVIYKGMEYVNEPVDADIDLGKYGVDIIEQDEEMYLPLTVLQLITGEKGAMLVYADNAISFTPGFVDPIIDCSASYNNMTRTSAEADYTYRMLSLFMDTAYGCPPMCALSTDIESVGFDAAMDMTDDRKTVKTLLKSLDTIDFFFGMTILNEMLYDGGHTELTEPLSKYSGMTAVDEYNKIMMFDSSDYRTKLYDKYRSINYSIEDKKERILYYFDGYKAYTPYFIEYDFT